MRGSVSKLSEQMLEQANLVQATDRRRIAEDNINMQKEFSVKLLLLVDRGQQAAAIALVHQFCS